MLSLVDVTKNLAKKIRDQQQRGLGYDGINVKVFKQRQKKERTECASIFKISSF